MKMSKHQLTSEQTENCREGINIYTNRLLDASFSYDKGILSLATATLGYTFVFAKYILSRSCSSLLAFTWFFLILSILFVLISFVIEQVHSKHRINYYYWCLTGKGKPVDKKKSHWSDDDWMLLPIFSGGFYLIGVILFTIYVGNSV